MNATIKLILKNLFAIGLLVLAAYTKNCDSKLTTFLIFMAIICGPWGDND